MKKKKLQSARRRRFFPRIQNAFFRVSMSQKQSANRMIQIFPKCFRLLRNQPRFTRLKCVSKKVISLCSSGMRIRRQQPETCNLNGGPVYIHRSDPLFALSFHSFIVDVGSKITHGEFSLVNRENASKSKDNFGSFVRFSCQCSRKQSQ